ncbi:hypothetical protein HK097_001728 [Rhizophlyctis rosea]|uniref:Uncharacterized protein n=1 Tax=Rhizophlyctis rosea TaxID=64517 RepID=A0AAD5SG01_9FUNG|nr:hypothetical protein HK097_001728 [Rhizophlyctis rosea]
MLERKGRKGKVKRRRRQRISSDDSDEERSSGSEESDNEMDEDDDEEWEKAYMRFRGIDFSSPHVVASLDFVFIVESDSEELPQNFLSGGWTLLHLFDPNSNGLDLESLWGPNGQANHVDKAIKLVPIFDGTPRALPFIAGSIVGTSSGYQVIFSYPSTPRPDIRPACNPHPHLRRTQEEHNHLQTLSSSHDHSFPNSLTPTPLNTLPLPKILEHPVHIEEDGTGCELAFNGNVELQRFMRRVNGVAVVFSVKY